MKLICIINKIFVKYIISRISFSNFTLSKIEMVLKTMKMVFKTIYNFTNETYKNDKNNDFN